MCALVGLLGPRCVRSVGDCRRRRDGGGASADGQGRGTATSLALRSPLGSQTGLSNAGWDGCHPLGPGKGKKRLRINTHKNYIKGSCFLLYTHLAALSREVTNAIKLKVPSSTHFQILVFIPESSEAVSYY